MKTRPGPDTAMKRFWENNERFADLFNAVFFDGREVIKPELLTERNGDVSASVPVRKQFEHVKKYQDVTKYYDGVELTILGVENQLRVNYAMPLVVISDPENEKIPYKNESVKALMTQLYLLYNENWDEIQRQDVRLDNDTAQLLASVVGNKKLKTYVEKEKGEIRMISALEKLEKTKWNEGRRNGIHEGMRKGINQGRKQGMKQGMELTYLVIQAIKKNPEWTNKQIAKACKCSEKMVEKIRSMFEI